MMPSRLTLPSSLPACGKVAILCIITVFLFVVSQPASAAGVPKVNPLSPTDIKFKKARALIESQKPNIDYSKLCSNYPLPGGTFKRACRMTKPSSVGFLVCKKDDEICEVIIQDELNAFQKIIKDGIRRVKVDLQMIKGVKCTNTKELTCAGFLEEWVDKAQGEFVHLSQYFSLGEEHTRLKVEPVLRKVNKHRLAVTAFDIEKNRKYIDKHPKYHQICDIQGFFLYAGGFLVIDPAGVRDGMGLDDKCYDPHNDPTTAQVINGLDIIIKELQHTAAS